MGQYTNKGLLNGYKKNNKERAELDYYATPTAEVKNFLDYTGYNFDGLSILEPCVGGGHMANGIKSYLDENGYKAKLIGSDVIDRGFTDPAWTLHYGLTYDFLDDDYPVDKADVVIMNPPFATLEPFIIRGLEIAQNMLVVFCRLQAVESKDRYEHIFAEHPFSKCIVYVDRVQCWKNGVKPAGTSAQAYCWLVWDKDYDGPPTLDWIRRASN